MNRPLESSRRDLRPAGVERTLGGLFGVIVCPVPCCCKRRISPQESDTPVKEQVMHLATQLSFLPC